MKKIKGLVAIIGVFLMVLSLMVPVKAKAATPDTWKIYFDAGANHWAMKLNDKDTGHWELYYLYQDFKDGDKLVIDGYGSTFGITVELGDRRISELAFCGAAVEIVYAKYVDLAYTTTSATGVINGDVGTAMAVDDSTLQINGNVNTMTLKKADGSGAHANVHVSGTVAYAEVAQRATGLAALPAYNFVKDTFDVKNNEIYLQTDPSNYSLVGTVPAASQTATATQTPSNKKLDAVPKTGSDFDFAYVLLGMGGAFMVLALICGKKMYRTK